MDYKELFKRLYKILFTPKQAWIEISTESPRRDVMATFVYPFIALCGLAVLLSAFIHDGLGREVYQPALMEMLSYCISLFGGFFLASYLVDMTSQKYLQQSSNMILAQSFVGYSMGGIFIADIIITLFPQFFIFKWILLFYIIYIVWEGSIILFSINEDKRFVFTLLSAAATIISPIIIRSLFNMLSNTLG